MINSFNTIGLQKQAALLFLRCLLMFVLVSLTLFQNTNVNTSLLQRGIKLYNSHTACLPYFLFSCAAQSKSHVQKSRQSHLPVFWKFSLQNLGKSPKSLHTTSE